MNKLLLGIFLGLLLLLLSGTSLSQASPYGSGEYGTCTYNNTCSISVSTTGTVTLNVEPTSSGVYTIDNDEVTVATNSTSGYTLTLESSSDSENSLLGSSDEITVVSGTPASPSALSGNAWGYRVDDFSGFGSGPTSNVENQSSNSLTFAGVPLLNNGAVIKTTSTDAPSGDMTDVWYGVRIDFDTTPDTYTQTVTYTAVTL